MKFGGFVSTPLKPIANIHFYPPPDVQAFLTNLTPFKSTSLQTRIKQMWDFKRCIWRNGQISVTRLRHKLSSRDKQLMGLVIGKETEFWHFHDDYPFQQQQNRKHLEAKHVLQICFILQSRLEIIINKKKNSWAGVNFTNVFTSSFYTCRSQKCNKLLDFTVFCRFWDLHA